MPLIMPNPRTETLGVGIPAEIKKRLPDTGELEGAKTSGGYIENGKTFKWFFENHPDVLNLFYFNFLLCFIYM